MRIPFLLAFVSLLAGPTFAQEVPSPARLIPHVRVIGGSVSCGFRDGPMFGALKQGDSVPLPQILGNWLGESVRVTTHSPLEMLALFNDPERIGGRQVQGALKTKPDFVIAVDFLFWFSYGLVIQEQQRLELLEKGLALLDQLEMPVLLGDLPDMRGAAERMLSPHQVPSPEMLQLLNKRLAEFVKERPRFLLIPLARFVGEIKAQGARLPLEKTPLQTRPNALLQADRLHATRLGMALLAYTLQDPLRALFASDHPSRKERLPFERFVEAAEAEDELEALQATPTQEEGAQPVRCR